MTAARICEAFTKHVVDWLQFQYVKFVRVKLGPGTMPKLEDLSIVYRSDHFLVVDKRHDIVVNSDEGDVISVASQLQHKYPELIDRDVHFGFRFVFFQSFQLKYFFFWTI